MSCSYSGIVAMVMMLAAIVLSLGNTRFHASIVVSNHRVTVGDTVSVIVGIDNTGRTPTTTARRISANRRCA